MVSHLAVLCLTFWEPPKFSPQRPKHFTFLPAVPESCNSPTSLPVLMFWGFFGQALIAGVKRCLTVVLIYISQIAEGDERLFVCLGTMCMFSLFLSSARF